MRGKDIHEEKQGTKEKQRKTSQPKVILIINTFRRSSTLSQAVYKGSGEPLLATLLSGIALDWPVSLEVRALAQSEPVSARGEAGGQRGQGAQATRSCIRLPLSQAGLSGKAGF